MGRIRWIDVRAAVAGLDRLPGRHHGHHIDLGLCHGPYPHRGRLFGLRDCIDRPGDPFQSPVLEVRFRLLVASNTPPFHFHLDVAVSILS